MMLLGNSKPEQTRISLQFPDSMVVTRKRPRSSASPSSAAAYNFDTDAEEEARDAALNDTIFFR
jgi:hypothetical protein